MDRRWTWLKYLPFAVGLLITIPGWNNAFLLDDLSKIVGNPDIRSLEGLARKLIYPYREFAELERNDPSRPLAFFLYTLVYAFAGSADPVFFHALNGILHGVCAFLAWALSRTLLRNLTGRSQTTVPLLVSFAFAVAPLQVGVASYAYSLSDLLLTTFALGSCWLVARGRSPRSGLVLLLFVLGLSSKQSAAVIPALWLLVMSLRAERPRAKEVTPQLVPAAGILMLYLVARWLYFGAVGDLEAQFEARRPWDYLLTQGFALFRYAQLSLVPTGLAVDHFIDYTTWSFALRITGIAGVLAILFFSSRTLTALSFGVLWFFVCHAPTTLMLTTDLLVERRSYLANFGLFFGVCAGAQAWLASHKPQLTRRAALWAGGVMVAYAAISWHRQTIYRTATSTWENVLQVYPASIRARNNLAIAYVKEKKFREAQFLYESLLRDNPRDAYALVNLGNLFDREDSPWPDPDRALALFVEARKLKPDYVDAHYNYALNLHRRNRLQEAEAAYRMALTVAPRHVPSLNNLGVILFNSQREAEGRHLIETALSLNPNYEPAQNNKNNLLSRAAPSTANEVPLDQVPPSVIVETYRKHLKNNPSDEQARKKFEEFCREHKLDCN